jgi:hypothetical protein
MSQHVSNVRDHERDGLNFSFELPETPRSESDVQTRNSDYCVVSIMRNVKKAATAASPNELLQQTQLNGGHT